MEALFSDYEDIRTSGLFDADYYLKTYPDVARRNVDPLVHYLEEGGREGRNPHPDFDGAFYLEQCRRRGEEPNNPLLHYLRIGSVRGFATQRSPRERKTAAAEASRREATAGKQPILMAIESLGVIGAPDGGLRLSLSGWALATTLVTDITALVNGDSVGTATYGLARPDIARLYPTRPEAAQSGFILAFDLPVARAGADQPVLTIRTSDGEVGHHPLQFDVPPQEVEVGVVDPLNPAAGETQPEPPPMQLQIDAAEVDRSGMLRLEGWVLCSVQIEALEGFIDGERLGPAEFGRVRSDIEQGHPDYPNSRFSGFRLIADVSAYGSGRRTVSIEATARGGVAARATADVEIPEHLVAPHAPPDVGLRHHLDSLTLTTTGRLAFRGWAVGLSPVAALVVELDGEPVGEAELRLERPDLGNLFPTLPHARQPGFAFDARLAKPLTGQHQLTLQFRCVDGRTDSKRVPVVAGEPKHPLGTVTAEDPNRQLHLDEPLLIGGAAATPIRGNLQISGWALARNGVAAIEIGIDGKPLALADYGLRRLDVQAALPDWDGALSSGFQALIPHRLLPAGSHLASVALRDKAGGATSVEFRIEVEELSDTPGPWSLRRKMAQAEIGLYCRLIEQAGPSPQFVALLPLAGGESLQPAATTIKSLRAQAYPHWRLLIIPHGESRRPSRLRELPLAGSGVADDRIEIIPELTPRVVAAAGAADAPTYFTVLTPGDELGVDALLELVAAVAINDGADFLYSDERCRNPATGTVGPFFKPDWSPDLLLSANYIGRLWCARGSLLAAVAGLNGDLLRHGEYDLVLRCTERAKAIRHVPAVLCERGGGDLDTPAQAREALERALTRRGIVGDIQPGDVAGVWRLKRALARPGLVSIVIPTCAAGGLIETCITSLRRLTAYRNYEIVCIENIPQKDRKWRTWLRRNADRVISTSEKFNWARFNNLAVAQASGEYLLFLNDDIEIVDPDWLGALIEHAQRPEVGLVGPLLRYPDQRVQHAGMFLAAIGQARHAFRYAAPGDPGYFGLAATTRNVIAVTGACLITRRDTFAALGGFDETQAIVNNDLDYALRARERGLLTIYTPHARLVHHEGVSRAALDDDYDEAVFNGRWRDLFLSGDPYFSPHLSKSHDDFTIDDEPTQLLVTGRPVLRRDDIRKILVLKLDHIGDCIIAFPAVRRLRQAFPSAHITVLTSRSSQPVWTMEPSVDATIEFDFFHARSGLGELDRTEADWQELHERLAPEAFDLAVDLRKHTETRSVLQHTGARFLAGFDFRNQFPWLDISLEWTGDQIYARKRQHNIDDLVNLADAVAAACESERSVITTPPPGPSPAIKALKRTLPQDGALVCVHPTVGNDARQWPVDYFIAVIDRLVEADRASVVLIGAPGDEAVADAILAGVRHPKAIASLVGKLPLAELPALLAGVSLFLGNNSGPKHIAAGLGIPTVGIHSGTEDVREWGPVGPAAIAVARDMVCAPCYLAYAADCRRGLACLRELEPARVYEACRRLLPLGSVARESGSRAAAPARATRARARPVRLP